MAQVRMRTHISGGRADGSDWPHAGELLECGDGEAADLVAGGLAWPHDDGAKLPPDGAESHAEPQTAPVADDEPSPAPENGSESDDEDPNSPAVRAAKAEWVDHAVTQGFDRQVAESMTKAQLIAQFGNA